MKQRIVQECITDAVSFLSKHSQYTIRGSFIHYTFVSIDGEVVGFGTNRSPPNNFPKLSSYPYGSMIHSEVDAYFKFAFEIRKSNRFEVLNLRLSRDGQLRNSKPCKCCNHFLKAVGATDVYYSTDAGIVKYV
jgi:hypothetical protein